MLSTLDPFTSQIGATLIAVTNLFQVGFLWFTSYDVARHRALPAYLVVGFFWFLHLFFRESGRLVMLGIGNHGGFDQMLVIAGMICLLAMSVGFLLTDAIPRTRPLFAEDCPGGGSLVRSEKVPASAALVGEDVRVSDEPDRLAQVRKRYGLTKRETEVLSFLAEGRSSSYIAGELYLSDNTVRSYVKNIYQKLDVHSKQDLIDFMKE